MDDKEYEIKKYELDVKSKELEIKSKELDENKKIEIYKLKISFAKVAMTTIITGVIVTLINNSIKEKELILKTKESEQEYVRKFISHAMDDSLEKRVKFSHYFSKLLKGDWISYHNDLVEEFNISKEKVKSKTKEFAKALNSSSQDITAKIDTKFLYNEISRLKKYTFSMPSNGLNSLTNYVIVDIDLKRYKKIYDAISFFERGDYNKVISSLSKIGYPDFSGYPLLIASYDLTNQERISLKLIDELYTYLSKPASFIFDRDIVIDNILKSIELIRQSSDSKVNLKLNKLYVYIKNQQTILNMIE